YVLCLTAGEESNFYWDSLGGGAGCRIDFKGQPLADALAACPEIRHGPVSYPPLHELEAAVKTGALPAADIPFTKRFPYRHEKEYRFVWEGNPPHNPSSPRPPEAGSLADGEGETAASTRPPVLEFGLSLDAIDSITISDSLSAAAADSFRAVISRAVPDIPGRISLVTVHENKRWLAALSAVR
ncbi:MAG: hypothetical protein LBG74_08195, partial [Spirochaetaceae bacterium]|nr:hypothetical protein [Spirochaetaceae bacterium]